MHNLGVSVGLRKLYLAKLRHGVLMWMSYQHDKGEVKYCFLKLLLAMSTCVVRREAHALAGGRPGTE